MDSDFKMAFKLVITLTCFVALFYLGTRGIFGPIEAEYEARKTAYTGEIVNKEIINAKHGLFTSSDTDYRLVIQVEYEHAGEMKETKKSFSVDKETYLSADVGDIFDSHNLEVTKQNVEESDND